MSTNLNWTKNRDLIHEFILAGNRIFIQGRQNGAFRGKWDGVWDMPMKLADYVKLAIWSPGTGVEWLDASRGFTVGFGYVDNDLATRQHGLEVTRRIFVPDEEEGVIIIVQFTNKSSENKLFHFFAEIYVDLRPRERDDNPSNYLVKFNAETGAIITCGADARWFVVFGSDRSPNGYFLGDFYDDLIANGTLAGKGTGKSSNAPGRSCLEYHVKLEPAETQKFTFVIVGNSISEEEAWISYKHIIGGVDVLFNQKLERYLHVAAETVTIETPDKSLDKAFIWAKINLEMLKHNQPMIGRGFFAGYPWFTMYWGRDSGWLLQAVDNYGGFDAVEDALFTLAKYQATFSRMEQKYKIRQGEIPNEIRMDGTIIYYSADATPLFVLAVWHHWKWTGNRTFLREIYPHLSEAVRWGFLSDENGDSLIEHYGDGVSGATWMDTYPRAKAAVEVEALWCEALRCASEIAEIQGDVASSEKWMTTAKRVGEKLNTLYWNESQKFLYDVILPDGKPSLNLTINPIVPVFYNQIEQTKASAILDRVEREFTAPWGVRTRSKLDPEYDGNSYHKGNVWGLTTGWVAWAEFAQDNPSKGLSYLKILADLMNVRCLGAIPEVLSGDAPTPSGCPLQAWSSSVLIQGVVEYMFGIKPDAFTRSLTIDPCLPEDWGEAQLRNLRIGDLNVDVAFRGEKNHQLITILGSRGYKVTASFRLPKKAEIVNIRKNGGELPLNAPTIKTVQKPHSLRLYIVTEIKPNQPLTLEVLFKGGSAP